MVIIIMSKNNLYTTFLFNTLLGKHPLDLL